MNRFSAVITGQTIVLVERNSSGLVCQTLGEEARPASLADADMALAAMGYGRTAGWDLESENLAAPIERVDNSFNGVRAARFDAALGTTHADRFELVSAATVENGDLVTDAEESVIYVVAGSDGTGKIHMVAEGKTWEDRHTSTFGLIRVARKR
jgi:hypothetical protein